MTFDSVDIRARVFSHGRGYRPRVTICGRRINGRTCHTKRAAAAAATRLQKITKAAIKRLPGPERKTPSRVVEIVRCAVQMRPAVPLNVERRRGGFRARVTRRGSKFTGRQKATMQEAIMELTKLKERAAEEARTVH